MGWQMIVRVLLAVLVAGTSAQPAIPLASEVTLRHEILRQQGVTGYLLSIPPGEGTQMHRHDKDLLTVFITGGRTTAVFEGSPPRTDALAAGTVRYRNAGFAHSTRNVGNAEFRAVLFEFDEPQGPPSGPTKPQQVLCTDRFCVEDATFQPGETLTGREKGLFVPIDDIEVREVSGDRRAQPAGTAWAGLAGWTNEGRRPARVISIRFR